MAASTKKQAKTTPIDSSELLKGLDVLNGRVFLKHSKKFAAFPELLGMQEK